MSLCIDGSIVPGTRLAVRNVNGKKVLCTENRDQFSIHREVAGNLFVPDDTLQESVTGKSGIYLETVSQMPIISIYADTLSQSKRPFMKAEVLADNTVLNFIPSHDEAFIIQGLGRGAKETVYLTGDTLNYAGLKFVKMPPAETMKTTTSKYASKTTEKVLPTKTQQTVADELIKKIKKVQQM
jgi:hypothetical protein